MRKKDEGSYALDEPRRSPATQSYPKPGAPHHNREFYAWGDQAQATGKSLRPTKSPQDRHWSTKFCRWLQTWIAMRNTYSRSAKKKKKKWSANIQWAIKLSLQDRTSVNATIFSRKQPIFPSNYSHNAPPFFLNVDPKFVWATNLLIRQSFFLISSSVSLKLEVGLLNSTTAGHGLTDCFFFYVKKKREVPNRVWHSSQSGNCRHFYWHKKKKRKDEQISNVVSTRLCIVVDLTILFVVEKGTIRLFFFFFKSMTSFEFSSSIPYVPYFSDEKNLSIAKKNNKKLLLFWFFFPTHCRLDSSCKYRAVNRLLFVSVTNRIDQLDFVPFFLPRCEIVMQLRLSGKNVY